LVAEAEENNLGAKVLNERWLQWSYCSLCEQRYHGVVWCALGWACWKTYVGRPEADEIRASAMNVVGRGLFEAGHYPDALSVQEAEVSTMRRVGASEGNVLAVQGNLSNTYMKLGRREDALLLKRDVYFGTVKLLGEEHSETLIEAGNYAVSLIDLERFEEAKSLLRKLMPVTRRVVGESHEITLRNGTIYAAALNNDPSATLDDLREAVTTLEDAGRIARRVFGSAHPLTTTLEAELRKARAALRAREAPSRAALRARSLLPFGASAVAVAVCARVWYYLNEH
jgi:hypothetical protein